MRPRLRDRALGALATFAAWALATFVLTACNEAVGVRGVTWSGRPLPVAVKVANPDDDALRTVGLGSGLPWPPRNLYAAAPGEWGDSLRLLEFGDELEAYAAFQEIAADPGDISVGVTVLGARVCFRRGRWVGLLDGWSWKGASWYDTALALPGATETGKIPKVFDAMLHQGRLPGSERILTRNLLGVSIRSPALAVAMDCHGDTAWLYVAPSTVLGHKNGKRDTVDLDRGTENTWDGWRRDSVADGMFLRQSRDLPPAWASVSAHGVTVVEGCFDQKLGNNWIKRQKSSHKVIKKSLNTLKSLIFD